MYFLTAMLAIALTLGVPGPGQQFNEWNKKSTLSTDCPVELPGIVLEPGVYIVKLLDTKEKRSLVQIWNSDEHLLQEIDLSQPLDLVDPGSKTDYFTAAQALDKLAYAGTPTASVQPIAYWENLFPAAAGPGLLSGNNGQPCAGGRVRNPPRRISM